MQNIVEASAPSRANLIGEHTDYNLGYVMPTPLPYKTSVRIETSNDNQIRIKSKAFKDDYVFVAGANKKGGWADYVCGVLELLREQGHDLPGLSIMIDSDVPMGMGLSSSAALTVSTFRALSELLELNFDDTEIAKLAHKIESEYVGVPCGIMDQMVSSTGKEGYALFLDTKTMETEYIKLPDGYKFCILHSGIKHELKDGDGGYKQRVAECQEACKLLGVTSLREMTADHYEQAKTLPDPINRRAMHIYTENKRVLDAVEALKNNDIETYGRLMSESHTSQRDDYEVSVPKIDVIVEHAMKHGAIGARLTGGGFGGSVICLLEEDKVDAWWKKLSSDVKGITLL